MRGRAAPASCLRHLSTRSPFSARSIQPPGSARLRLFSKQTAVIFSFIVVFEKKLFFLLSCYQLMHGGCVYIREWVKVKDGGVEGGAGAAPAYILSASSSLYGFIFLSPLHFELNKQLIGC